MKKYLALILSIFCLEQGIVKGQTNVTGGIYSNTTWSLANSPYIVTDTVMVFPNVLLTIQPGVVVKFNTKGLLEVRGYINANGTSSDSIVFTSNSSTPKAGDYYGVIVETDTNAFNFCRISYANKGLYYSEYLGNPISHCLFNSDLEGISFIVGTAIDTCTFMYDTSGLFNDDEGAVIGCTFLYNGTAIGRAGSIYSPIENCTIEYNTNGIDGDQNYNVTNCTIRYNKDYGINGDMSNINTNDIEFNYIGVESSNSNITYNNISNNYIGLETAGGINMIDSVSVEGIVCNSFCNNTDFNLISLSAGDFSVKDNYWCLTDSAHIQATIYDGYQKLTLGLVFFTPFYDSACSNVPSAIDNLLNSAPQIKVHPNPSTGIFAMNFVGLQNFESAKVEVYNVLGEKVYSNSYQPMANGYQLDLRSQPNGVYFYRVLREDERIEGEGKLVIEK